MKGIELEYDQLSSSVDQIELKPKKSISDQSHFFFVAGLCTLVPFTTLVAMDEFWKTHFRHDATNYYPFFANGGGLIALIFYEKLNRMVSFKQQLRLYPIFVVMTFPILFSLGKFFGGSNEQSWLTWKNICFILLVVL